MVERVIGDPPFGLGSNGLNPAITQFNGFLLEFMGTLVLCSAVHMTTTHAKSLSSGVPHMAPTAIGFAVFLAHVVLIPLTGCGINPARTLGPAVVNSFAGNAKQVWDDAYWIYFVGPYVAAMMAAALAKVMEHLQDGDNDNEQNKNKTKKKDEEILSGSDE